jgi:hypothetical protein
MVSCDQPLRPYSITDVTLQSAYMVQPPTYAAVLWRLAQRTQGRMQTAGILRGSEQVVESYWHAACTLQKDYT